MDFDTAAQTVKDLKNDPGNDKKLELYGLFKQVTKGDNTSKQPWAIQVEARAKWEAWEKNKGKSKEDASAEYIKLAQELKAWDDAQ